MIVPARCLGNLPGVQIPCDAVLHSDSLDVLRRLPDAEVDLIYVDPPFGTGRKQNAREGEYADERDDPVEFIAWLHPYLAEMRRVLKATGSLYLHLDFRSSHYAKVDLDQIFGRECFLNHIVWLYGLGGSSPRYWPRKHDDLLWYSRTPNGHYFQPDRQPATSQRMKGQDKKVPDHWDIPALNNMASERVGYPTQKPLELLERIVRSSCPEGGLVADFFCGSGTTGVAAKNLGRRYLLCDASADAVEIAKQRLR